MRGDLTTLANLKTWLGVSSNSEDATMARLITAVSQVIRNYCQRDTFLSQDYTETYDGTGSDTLLLRQFPVTALKSLSINGVSVPAQQGQGPGYSFDSWNGYPSGRPHRLSLNGSRFGEGRNNVAVTYTAGYLTSQEPATVSSTDYRALPIQPMGSWAGDAGVTYANGTPLTAVAANPTAGQYVPPQPFGAVATTAWYQFSAADAGAAVFLNYSFTPADIENICVELAAERLKYRARIGERSHSTGGQETVSFLITDFPPWAKSALQSYRGMVPL